jgi:PAS domain S-box-containing protein
LQIFDSEQLSADSLLYDSKTVGEMETASQLTLKTASRLTLKTPTAFNDRIWYLCFTQTGAHSNYVSAYSVLSSGTIISLLLFWLICSLLNTRYRAQQLAEQLTVDIRESEESYRNQFVNNSAAMLLIDPADGAIIDANVKAIGFYGYPREKLLTMRITDINTLPASEVWQAMAAILPKEGKQYEFQHRLADGSLRDVSVSASRIQFGGRAILHSIIHDITERKLTEDSLQKSEAAMRGLLSEKDMLLKEVHHRVKNNLAAIIGLLDLQGSALDNKPARAALEELSNRIRSMSLVHEQLYQSKDLSQIDFQDYLDRLIAHLSSSYQRSENIHISVAAKGVKMGLDNAIPCGLLITELVTNAFKYAFPADMPCTEAGAGGCEIAVSMQWDGAAYKLVVADNGVGLPAGLDWTKTKTLGLLLVKMLGQHQLQGQVELYCTGGTTFQLQFAPKNTRDFLHTKNS